MMSSSSEEGDFDDDLQILHEERPSASCSTASSQGEPSQKRRKKNQCFVDSWLSNRDFRQWLVKKMGADNKTTAFCKICDKAVTCSKTGLKRHMASNSHQKNMRAVPSCPISSVLRKADTQEETAVMEIKLCSFIAEHYLPLSISDDLLTFLRSLFPKNNVLKNVKLGKQKATNVVRQVIGFDYLNEAVTALRSRKFSFIIDETTDKSTSKQLAILTTYFDMESFQLKKYLLDMIEVDDGSAKGIYSALKQSFNELRVPMDNIIGYSSDTTNVMFGEHNSVSQLLKADYPTVVTVKCSCHLIHLASSHAALTLPKGLEDLCRDIFAHFHRSSKRQNVYQEFQQFFNVEPHQLLSPGQTRWLLLEACVNRILEQYIALQHYFVLVTNEDPTHSNERILKSLDNKFNLAYLEFLSHQLERFNNFNRLFQGERPLLHCLKDEVEGLIRSIASDFMKIPFVKAASPKKIDPTKVENQLPLKEIYLGVAATATLHEIKENVPEDHVDVKNFYVNCRNFLIEIILQVQRRFDLDSEIYDVIQCISPKKAAARVPSSLAEVVKKLPYLDTILNVRKLDAEWREHALDDNLAPSLKWEEYWNRVKDAKVPSGEEKYPNLTMCVEVLASFPFSNAAVERIFSLLKRVKTDDRTRLKSASLVSLLQCKLGMKNGNYNAASLTPGKHALTLMSQMKASATDQEAKDLKTKFLNKLFE